MYLLNTGIPSFTFNGTWVVCNKITGWGLFAQIPRVSLNQKITITKAEIYDSHEGWKGLTVKSALASGAYMHLDFSYTGTLADGIYLCRITGKLER